MVLHKNGIFLPLSEIKGSIVTGGKPLFLNMLPRISEIIKNISLGNKNARRDLSILLLIQTA